MEELIGLLVGLLEAGLALWFLIDLVSNMCFKDEIHMISKFSY